MEGLRLTADGNDVLLPARFVAPISVTGPQTRTVLHRASFARTVRSTSTCRAAAPRMVRDVSFTCRSDERGGAKIYLSAEIGRFRNDWMKSPLWASFWSHMFRWGNADNGNRSELLGHARPRELRGPPRPPSRTSRAGPGRNVERIGLRAVNGDARCAKVRVTFGNGSTANLDVGRLDQGRVKQIDLPGGNRNIRSLNLVCSAVNKSAVTVETPGAQIETEGPEVRLRPYCIPEARGRAPVRTWRALSQAAYRA